MSQRSGLPRMSWPTSAYSSKYFSTTFTDRLQRRSSGERLSAPWPAAAGAGQARPHRPDEGVDGLREVHFLHGLCSTLRGQRCSARVGAGRAAWSPHTHLHQRQVLHGGRAQRRGPFPHRVVAHPAVDASPARVHPQAVLHAQVLCGEEQPGCGSVLARVALRTHRENPLGVSTSPTPAPQQLPQPPPQGIAARGSRVWMRPRCTPRAAGFLGSLTHERAVNDANGDGHQGPALGADLGRAGGRAQRGQAGAAAVPCPSPTIPRYWGRGHAASAPGNLQHVRTSS